MSVNDGTISSTMQTVETDLNLAAGIGAAVGGPTGAAVDAALQGAEGVVNTVVAASPHQTALTDIQNAVTAAAPVISQATTLLSPTSATKVNTGLTLLQTLLADIVATYDEVKAAV